jgi:hypothetical protein
MTAHSLLTLPAELRLQIYTYILPTPVTSHIRLLDPLTQSPRCCILIRRTLDLSFLLVSKQIHSEASRMFHRHAVQTLLSSCAVRILFPHEDLNMCVSWLEDVYASYRQLVDEQGPRGSKDKFYFVA